jgi:hypothetical protein
MRGYFISIDKENDPIYVRQVSPEQLDYGECLDNAADLVQWLENHAPFRTFEEVKRIIKEIP